MKEFPAVGRHVLIEMYECNPEVLNEVCFIEEIMVEAARMANATIIHTVFHHFSPYGVSGVVVIQESHLTIHTWPEYGYAAMDIYTCGDEIDPWIAYQYIKEKLKAGYASPIEILRGHKHLLTPTSYCISYSAESFFDERQKDKKIQPTFERQVWFTERHGNVAFSFRYKGKEAHREQSPFQKIEIFDTHAYGKMLVLDGLVMTSEKDEFCYHEMMVHPAMIIHPSPSRVLVIGGGDGGVIKEVLKHPGVEKIQIVEIDRRVIEVSKQYLPSIAYGFDDPKVEIIIQDGATFIKDTPDGTYDVIFVDCSDPSGPSLSLFTPEFYSNLRRIAREDGIVVLQTESPHFSEEVIQRIYKNLSQVWGVENVFMYLTSVPTYTTGLWTLAFCSTKFHPLLDFNYERASAFAKEHNLKYYDADIHIASFFIPRYMKTLVPYAANTHENFSFEAFLPVIFKGKIGVKD